MASCAFFFFTLPLSAITFARRGAFVGALFVARK
jgi:hypothetical protein